MSNLAYWTSQLRSLQTQYQAAKEDYARRERFAGVQHELAWDRGNAEGNFDSPRYRQMAADAANAQRDADAAKFRLADIERQVNACAAQMRAEPEASPEVELDAADVMQEFNSQGVEFVARAMSRKTPDADACLRLVAQIEQHGWLTAAQQQAHWGWEQFQDRRLIRRERELLGQLKRPDDAAKLLDEEARVFPNDAELQNLIWANLEQSGNYPALLARLAAKRQVAPDDRANWEKSKAILKKLDRKFELADLLEQQTAHWPNDSGLEQELQAALDAAGAYPKLFQRMRDQRKSQPNNASLWKAHVDFSRRSDRRRYWIQYLGQLCRADQADPLEEDEYLTLLEESGDWKMAAEHLQQRAKQQPQNNVLRERLRGAAEKANARRILISLLTEDLAADPRQEAVRKRLLELLREENSSVALRQVLADGLRLNPNAREWQYELLKELVKARYNDHAKELLVSIMAKPSQDRISLSAAVEALQDSRSGSLLASACAMEFPTESERISCAATVANALHRDAGIQEAIRFLNELIAARGADTDLRRLRARFLAGSLASSKSGQVALQELEDLPVTETEDSVAALIHPDSPEKTAIALGLLQQIKPDRISATYLTLLKGRTPVERVWAAERLTELEQGKAPGKPGFVDPQPAVLAAIEEAWAKEPGRVPTAAFAVILREYDRRPRTLSEVFTRKRAWASLWGPPGKSVPPLPAGSVTALVRGLRSDYHERERAIAAAKNYLRRVLPILKAHYPDEDNHFIRENLAKLVRWGGLL